MNIGQEIVKELLQQASRNIAIFGGGFKPPTKGHFEVAKLALENHPDIDELIISVGTGVRNGVTQDQSVAIWEIYKNYLLGCDFSHKGSFGFPTIIPTLSDLGSNASSI